MSTGRLLAHYLELLLARTGQRIERAELAALATGIDGIAPPLHQELGQLRTRVDHVESHLDTLDTYLERKSR